MNELKLLNLVNNTYKRFNNLEWIVLKDSVQTYISLEKYNFKYSVWIYSIESIETEVPLLGLWIEFLGDHISSRFYIKNLVGTEEEVFNEVEEWLTSMKLAFQQVC